MDDVTTPGFTFDDTEQALTVGRRDRESLNAVVITTAAESFVSVTR